MKMYPANRNLAKLLYRNNDLEKFNAKLRQLIHGTAPFVERADGFGAYRETNGPDGEFLGELERICEEGVG